MSVCASAASNLGSEHSMDWRIIIFRAVVVAVAAFLFAICVVAVQAVFQFDGKCGGLIPFLSAAQPCTLSQYVWSSLSFTVAVFFQEYWLIGLVFAGMVVVGSVIFERLRSHQNAV